jgi:DNA-binding phage protein
MRNGYKTYNFVDKDPVIDELRTIIQDTAALKGVSENRMWDTIADDIGMSRGTLWKWFVGDTCYPRHAGVKAVARALGRELKLVGSNVATIKRKAA